MTQERIQKKRSEAEHRQDVKDAQDSAEVDAEVQAAQQNEADLTHTDELLDEIDALLEENAQEFVANFIQWGGE